MITFLAVLAGWEYFEVTKADSTYSIIGAALFILVFELLGAVITVEILNALH